MSPTRSGCRAGSSAYSTGSLGFNGADAALKKRPVIVKNCSFVCSYGYGAAGNQVYFTNTANVVTTNVSDVLNRLVETLFPDGTATRTIYDAVGRRIASVDQANITTGFAYDGAGRLTSVTNALGKMEQMITGYEYDEAGNLLRQIDALERTNV